MYIQCKISFKWIVFLWEDMDVEEHFFLSFIIQYFYALVCEWCHCDVFIATSFFL
jgi:hypothetical protein